MIGLDYDPSDKCAWLFRPMVASKHDVNEKGISELKRIGVKKFTYIAVTPNGLDIGVVLTQEVAVYIEKRYQLWLL